MVQGRMENRKLILSLSGEIDSSNAEQIEKQILGIRGGGPCDTVELNCDQLQYVSSAGLRVILRLIQDTPRTVMNNVHSELYEILDMTGFTEMAEVHKAYRVISVEGCEVIGQGANGTIYRIGPDTIVKVYLNPEALQEIHRGRELARMAFIAGVPTAIPYDVVRIEGGGYGSVFELLDADSFASLLISGKKTPDEVAKMSIDLLKIIHSKEVRSPILRDARDTAAGWADYSKECLGPELYGKFRALTEVVPKETHLMHGDFHLKNIMVQNGENLIIDMDTLCYGHPVFELSNMYNAYVGHGMTNPETIMKFLGIPMETTQPFWRRSLELYLGTENAKAVDEVENKVKVISMVRMIRHEVRRDGLNREDGRKKIEKCREQLAKLLPRVDSLTF